MDSIARPASPGQGLAALSVEWLRSGVGMVVPLTIVTLWYALLHVGVFAPYQLPYPQVVVTTMAELWARGELQGHIAITIQRVFIGFGFGALAGIAAGILVGLYRLADELFDPTLQGLRSIPSLAWVPLFLLWFGIGETSKILLIALGVFFPVYLNLADCIRSVDRKLIEVGRAYGLSRLAIARRIIVPATMPGLLTGLRGGMGLGWMFVVAAELIAASQGLGFLLSEGRVMARPDIVVGAIILFAILGKTSDVAIKLVQKRALHWQDVAKR